MKNINFEAEKKQLGRINRFYKKNQEKRDTLFAFLALGGIALCIVPGIIVGIVHRNTGYNVSNRIEPIKDIMAAIATIESEDKPSLQTLATAKNSISSSLSTIESCSSNSQEYRDLVLAVNKIKNKISDELSNRLNHITAIETSTLAMKASHQQGGPFDFPTRKNILSFIDGRCKQNQPFKDTPIQTSMGLG